MHDLRIKRRVSKARRVARKFSSHIALRHSSEPSVGFRFFRHFTAFLSAGKFIPYPISYQWCDHRKFGSIGFGSKIWDLRF
jgi:hypothetical protein